MDNLHIWEKVKVVPSAAMKTIGGGRLKGMSDINPVWRMKTLTEQFGPCGIGWKYEIVNKWLEKGSGEEVVAFVDINLYVKVDEVWSEAIPGTGGNSFVTKEKNGLYTSDECYKMALTDAISVSCKALGIGADVYWDKDRTKYSDKPAPPQQQKPVDKFAPDKDYDKALKALFAKGKELGFSTEEMKDRLALWYQKESTKDLTAAQLQEFRQKLIDEKKGVTV